MKLPAFPLLALALVLGGCETTGTPPIVYDNTPAVRAGDKVTRWGTLPSYDPKGHQFLGLKFPHFRHRPLRAEAKLDILVNPDGSVQDVAIFESSGDASIDRALAATVKDARYSLQLGPDDPAPYVVRLTMGVETETSDAWPINAASHTSAGP